MPLTDKAKPKKNIPKEIIVKSINKPTKEESIKKTKELSEFLSKTWQMPVMQLNNRKGK